MFSCIWVSIPDLLGGMNVSGRAEISSNIEDTVISGVCSDLEREGLAGEVDEDLNASTQAKDEAEGGFLLNVQKPLFS
jgi:hypothetical protein